MANLESLRWKRQRKAFIEKKKLKKEMKELPCKFCGEIGLIRVIDWKTRTVSCFGCGSENYEVS